MDALLTVGSIVFKGDDIGHFTVTSGEVVLVRAPGYRAARFTGEQVKRGPLRLISFAPHAIYLSAYGAASKTIRGSAMDIIRDGGANALVVDIKSDRGLIPFPSAIPLAKTAGARKLTLIRSLSDLVGEAHARGVYMIARIVTFEDPALGVARPDLAVHLANDTVFHDHQGLAWTDPLQGEVRAYNIAIAVEAAKAGFDEVQFDYVRFPDAVTQLKFNGAADEAGRVGAITTFLKEARAALLPYNIFLSVDIFGYVSWNLNDTGIGQQLEELVKNADYICPMLYPSGFKYGIPGHKNPMSTDEDIYNTVHLTLENSLRRTHANPRKFRPWLQAFRDYAFGGKVFGPGEVADQTRAANESMTDGWMLWNPRNSYTGIGLTR